MQPLRRLLQARPSDFGVLVSSTLKWEVSVGVPCCFSPPPPCESHRAFTEEVGKVSTLLTWGFLNFRLGSARDPWGGRREAASIRVSQTHVPCRAPAAKARRWPPSGGGDGMWRSLCRAISAQTSPAGRGGGLGPPWPGRVWQPLFMPSPETLSPGQPLPAVASQVPALTPACCAQGHHPYRPPRGD